MVLGETQSGIEAAAVGRHQIHPLGSRHRRTAEQGLHDAAPQALPLEFGRHHHIPEHGPEHPVARRPPDADQPAVPPGAHHRGTAEQHPHQGTPGALLGPETVGIEQLLQLLELKQQPQGQPAVAYEPDAAWSERHWRGGHRGGPAYGGGRAGGRHGCAGGRIHRPPNPRPPQAGDPDGLWRGCEKGAEPLRQLVSCLTTARLPVIGWRHSNGCSSHAQAAAG